MNNVDRFLAAFNEIEIYLRKRIPSDKHEPFLKMLGFLSGTNPLLARYYDDLRQFASLRNAMVHQKRGDRIIANPSDFVVEEIEQIAATLKSPPQLVPKFRANVLTVSVDDGVERAVSIMYSRSFSQLPVYQNGNFVSLLTSNTVMRWMAVSASDGIVSMGGTTIRDLLEHTEDRDNVVFLAKDANQFDAIHEFRSYEQNGKRLDAILITRDGTARGELLGILTVYDLPRLESL